jgi:hypothetical protein
MNTTRDTETNKQLVRGLAEEVIAAGPDRPARVRV